MTVPPAALPGHHDQAPTVHRAHPGGELRLGCPMCQTADDIVIDVPAVVHHRIEVWAVDAVTTPEFDVTETTVPGADTAPVEPITKIRCVRCRWSYTGTDCLRKLVAVE